MASQINYLSINENFPVAGQDNDTQVFRDNFDTIKTSLRNAKDEITTLQDTTAKLDDDNNFNLFVIQNAVLQNNRTAKFDGRGDSALTTSPYTVDFQNGDYQIFRIGNNIALQFLNLPGDPVYTAEVVPVGMGKITLELYGDGIPRTVTFTTSGGTVIKKDASFPASVILTSQTDPVFIEVWRHRQNEIFMRYLGQFS